MHVIIPNSFFVWHILKSICILLKIFFYYIIAHQISWVLSNKCRIIFLQLGIAIATLRKIRGLSQEKLAEKANISRSHLSAIKAPNLAHPFSQEVFFDIADALKIDPAELLRASVFPDSFMAGGKKE